jgi:hypothetical protein
MHEQRPPASPGVHPPQQPQRLAPAPHAQHPHPAQPPKPVLRASAAQASTASLPLDDDDDLIVLDDGVAQDDHGQKTGTAPGAGARAPATPGAASGPPAPKKITFSADTTGRQRTWKRKPHLSGTGACRVRTFHGKCSDQGLEYLDDAINAFLDEHPDIEVKFVQSNVAMFDGKFKDFALIVNLWY